MPQLSVAASSVSLQKYGKHNPQDTLSLLSSVDGYPLSRLSFQWTNSDPSSSLLLEELTPGSELLTDLISPNLVLDGDVLLAGNTYTLDLSVIVDDDESVAGWASVTVVTNRPPVSGTCSVTQGNNPNNPNKPEYV